VVIGRNSERVLNKSTILGDHRIDHQLPNGSTLILDLSVRKVMFDGEERFICEMEDKTQEIKLRSREGEIVETLVQSNLNLFKEEDEGSIQEIYSQSLDENNNMPRLVEGYSYLIILEISVKRR